VIFDTQFKWRTAYSVSGNKPQTYNCCKIVENWYNLEQITGLWSKPPMAQSP